MPFGALNNLLTPEALAPLTHAKNQVFVFLEWLDPYSTILSLLLITGIVYCFMRIEQIVHETKHHDKAHGHGKEKRGGKGAAAEEDIAAKRWERALSHLNSERESDWRLSVLEADVLLDEMITGMGYRGDSLGERLKSIEKSDFTTLDKAWEAHAVRNKIAHEGAAFALTEREAKRVVKLYEDVFEEFHYI